MATEEYLDFDIRIEPAADGRRVWVHESPAGEATAPFVLPLSAKDLEILVLRLTRGRTVTRGMSAEELTAAKSFGGQLFDALFTGETRTCLRSSLNEAEKRGLGLRIRLSATDAPDLMNLPWELLYDKSLNRFLALSTQSPVVRYLDLPDTPRPLAVDPPLRILVVVPSPSDYPPLDVAQEWLRLKHALADLEQRGLVILEHLPRATLADLQPALRRNSYHILHYIGHGAFDPDTRESILLFEDEDGTGHATSGEFLGTLLRDHPSLRLVVLNACQGARTSADDPFAGAAQRIMQQGVPAVLAMQFDISDQAAMVLSHEFYSAVADGYPIDAALAEARKAVYASAETAEWATPVLYLRAPDARIFDVAVTQSIASDGRSAYPLEPSEALWGSTPAPASVPPATAPTPGQVTQPKVTTPRFRTAKTGKTTNWKPLSPGQRIIWFIILPLMLCLLTNVPRWLQGNVGQSVRGFATSWSVETARGAAVMTRVSTAPTATSTPPPTPAAGTAVAAGGVTFAINPEANRAHVGERVMFTIQVKDAEGNVLDGYRNRVQFKSTDPDAFFAAYRPDPSELVTWHEFSEKDAGEFTFPITFNRPGKQTVTVIDQGNTQRAATSAEVEVLDATLSIKPATTQTHVGERVAITIQMKDAGGSLLDGYRNRVQFKSTDPNAFFAAYLPSPELSFDWHDFSETDAGEFTFPITFNRAGKQTVTAIDTGNPKRIVTSVVVEVLDATLSIRPAKTQTHVGERVAFTIQIKDAGGSLLDGYRNRVQFTSSDPDAFFAAYLPSPELPFDWHDFAAKDAGEFTFPITFNRPGKQTVTVTDTGNPKRTATSAVIEVK